MRAAPAVGAAVAVTTAAATPLVNDVLNGIPKVSLIPLVLP